jgi:hypothetical protein
MKTEIEKLKERMARAQAIITEVTTLDADKQNKAMFEAAYEWLETIGVHGDDQTLITSARQFWGFWKMEWHRLDMLFINYFNNHDCHARELRQMYDYIHNPRNKFLQGCITQAGYHQFIKSVRV